MNKLAKWCFRLGLAYLYTWGVFDYHLHRIIITYVTGPEKTGLIYIKYTYSYYGAYLSFYTTYFNSVNLNEQLRNFCTCDEICINILSHNRSYQVLNTQNLVKFYV